MEECRRFNKSFYRFGNITVQYPGFGLCWLLINDIACTKYEHQAICLNLIETIDFNVANLKLKPDP